MIGRSVLRERQLLSPPRLSVSPLSDLLIRANARRATWLRLLAQAAVVVALLCLAVANIAVRATWSELEDGVLWRDQGEGVDRARRRPRTRRRRRSGVQAGDVLIAVNGRAVQSRRRSRRQLFHGARRGDRLEYTVLRLQSQQMLTRRGRADSVGIAPRSTSRWRRSASSRCWSARRSGCGGRIIRPPCTSSGCASPSSACWPSRSAAGSTRSIASSTGATWWRC